MKPQTYLSRPIDCHKSYITSEYGNRIIEGKESFHNGIDIGTYSQHLPVFPVVPSIVLHAGMSDNRTGLRLWLHGQDNLFYFYCHLHNIWVGQGDFVFPFFEIGTTGNTGTRYKGKEGIHLHFEIRTEILNRASAINPRWISSQYQRKK